MHGHARNPARNPVRSSVRNAMFTLAAWLIAAFGASAVAFAGAPMAKGQAPGWYRMKVGDFEVTALLDGTLDLPMDQILTNTTPDKVKKALADEFLTSPVETSVNAFLVNTGTKLILIDAGASNLFGPTLGKMLANLKASGYQPDQVDEIYITHMHADHVGGLAAGDKVVFSNAVVRASKAEGDYWLSPAEMEKAPAQMKDFFKGAQASLKPYVAAGKYKPFEGADVELIPGVRALATPGHTSGHTLYAIESKGERMVFWGDLIHAEAVQMRDPSVTIQFDKDSKAAAPQRKKAAADAASKKHYVAVAHFSFPGIGHVRADGKGYEWIPANYTTK